MLNNASKYGENSYFFIKIGEGYRFWQSGFKAKMTPHHRVSYLAPNFTYLMLNNPVENAECCMYTEVGPKEDPYSLYHFNLY